MGSHRAPRRDSRRRASGGTAPVAPISDATERSVEPSLENLRIAAVAAVALPTPVVDLGARVVVLDDETAELPLTTAPTPGRRRAPRRTAHVGSRGPLFKGLPSAPALLGVAALVASVGGAVMAQQQPELASSSRHHVYAATAMTGTTASGAVEGSRTRTVSRDSSRGALSQAGSGELVEAAEAQAVERNVALGQLAQQAQQQADKLAENRWVLPLDSYRLTAEFGDYGLWATYHTGLDFAAPSGSPIRAVAGGTVTSVGYDGAYGNKTVITLEDGTELWYCHQTSTDVTSGDTVAAGQTIGTVGSTGNVTGPHLHLEVRPGGGDPVDPYAALVANGVTP